VSDTLKPILIGSCAAAEASAATANSNVATDFRTKDINRMSIPSLGAAHML
jgi:hypothetical protein